MNKFSGICRDLNNRLAVIGAEADRIAYRQYLIFIEKKSK